VPTIYQRIATARQTWKNNLKKEKNKENVRRKKRHTVLNRSYRAGWRSGKKLQLVVVCKALIHVVSLGVQAVRGLDKALIHLVSLGVQAVWGLDKALIH
jgi:hypothetical protein